MPNGQIRPIYQNMRTRDEKRYQLFSEQNLKVKNETEYTGIHHFCHFFYTGKIFGE